MRVYPDDVIADLYERFGDFLHECPEVIPAILEMEARETKKEAATERPQAATGVSMRLDGQLWGEVRVGSCFFRPTANEV